MSAYINNRRTVPVILGLTLLAFALRVYHLTYQSLWRDEVDALRFATQALPELLDMFRKHGENGPLFFLALRPWLAAAGHGEFALRFPSAWAGTLAVPVTYALVRRLTGWSSLGRATTMPATLAAFLMATAPYLVWYGQEAKMYALLTLLVPSTLLLAVQAARHGGRWRWVLLYIVTSVSFYVHLLAVLALAVQAVWLLIIPTGPLAARRRLHGLAYMAILVLPYLPLARWQLPMWLDPSVQNGYRFVLLPDILTVLTVAFSRGIMPVAQPATVGPFILALLAGVILWAQRWSQRQPVPGHDLESSGERIAPGVGQATPGPDWHAWKTVGLLAVWLLLPPLEIYLISLGKPIFLDRYLIWIMPAYLVLAAFGVVALTRIWRPLGLAVFGVVLAFNLTGVWTQANRPIKSDFRAAAGYVMAHRQAADLLVFQIPYNRYAFTYYSGEGFAWLDGPFTNGGMSEDAVTELLVRGTAGAPAAWLIGSEESLWDERQLTQAWFAAHGTATDQAEFARVSVERYELRK